MTNNFSNRGAYGDIYSVPTSAIDNIATRLVREQQQRELEKRQADKVLEDEFGKNVAGVKSADIPEITQGYNRYKQAHIALQKKGNKATPQDQMNFMIEKQNVFSQIAASKEEKERVKTIGGEVKADKKGRFILGASQKLAERLNKPTSQIKEEDWDLQNKYSFPDLAKVTATWLGKPEKVNVPTGAKSIKGDLYDDELVLQKYNHPNKIYENAFLEVSTRPDRQNFERVVLDSLTDEEKEKVKTDYFARISSPEFKRIYGEVQPFPESAAKTELGEAVALTTMGMVNNMPLKEVDIESKPNQTAIKDRNMVDWKDKQAELFEWWKKKNAITFPQSLAKIRLNKQGQDIVNGTSGNSFDEFGGVNPIVVNTGAGGITGAITGGNKVTGVIDKGIVYDGDGNLYTGEITVDKKDVPINVTTSMASGKVTLPKQVPLTVKNGIIVGLKTNNGVVDRIGIENLQKKVNTEPIKGAQPVYGKPAGTPPPKKTTAKPKNNPLGLKFD